MSFINSENIVDFVTKSGGKFGVNSLDSAYDFCRKITLGHYENFPVGSILIPKGLRNSIYSVYSFARIADDIADEMQESAEKKIEYLNRYGQLVLVIEDFLEDNKGNSQNVKNPVLWALSNTLVEKNLPKEPFLKLLEAFKRDAKFVQPRNFEEIVDYCKYSANPVGEIILRIFGFYNDYTKPYSDSICTALQLVNFWQDLSVDLARGRCYIPHDILQKYQLEIKNLQIVGNSVNLRRCLEEIYDYTYEFFKSGRELISYLDNKRLKLEIKVTIFGGELLLKKVRDLDTKIFLYRPKHKKIDILKILILIIFTKWKH